jgi:hypothetical protein
MSEDEQYFAVNSELDDLLGKVDDFYKQFVQVGQARRVKRSFSQYYGYGYNGKTDELLPGGEQGELTRISINKYRAYLLHMLSLITAERPATHVTPTNTDYQSMASAMVGEQILDYYMRAKDLEDVLYNATEKAMWSSEGYIVLDWDSDAGDMHDRDPDTDKVIMQGDIRYNTYSSDSMIRDIYVEKPDWYITVDYVNKWDEIARYPEHRDKILSSGIEYGGKWCYSNYFYNDKMDDDRIAVYRFFHKKTAALPEGRMVIFTNAVKLLDTQLPYREMPIYRIAPADIDGTNLGYTQGFDLLGAQETIDELYTAVVSNNMAFSRQCIVLPRNAKINHRAISDGLTVIEADAEDAKAIKPLQLTNSSPETYNLIDKLDGEMGNLTGINEVVKGQPGPNVRSGNAMALLSAQAIKFNSTLQQAYIKIIEDAGTGTLRFLQEFAHFPRFAEIVDKSDRAYLKEFDKDSLTGVSRVQVEVVSALSKTQAGRIEIANNLLDKGLIKRPEQYIAVLTSGKLEPIIEAEQSELLNIRAENEVLAEAGDVPTILTDNHALHIREHKCVLDNPDSRQNEDVVASVLAHIQQHLTIWAQTDPNVLMATGQQPMQAPPPPEAQPAPDGNMGPPGEVFAPGGSTEGEPGLPGLPALPEGSDPMDQAAYDQGLPPE